MSGIYLGLDTSNYRTSVAAADENGSIIFEKAVLLDVPQGSRGLRQSEAFWHHSGRLPSYIKELFASVSPGSVKAVGVSSRPRRVEGSYMPCFMAGVNLAVALGASLGVPVYEFSHQEGHAAAVLPEDEGDCIFMHLSGGTTEFLLCRPDSQGYDMTIAGGSRDISVGQLLDRFGVAAGAAFPSGRFLDDAAYSYIAEHPDVKASSSDVIPHIKVENGCFNLSGAETRLLRFAEKEGLIYTDEAARHVTACLFLRLAGVLGSSAAYLAERFGVNNVYMAGGVASSRTIRALFGRDRHHTLPELFPEKNKDVRIFFGNPAHSGDNAAGIAALARRMYK